MAQNVSFYLHFLTVDNLISSKMSLTTFLHSADETFQTSIAFDKFLVISETKMNRVV